MSNKFLLMSLRITLEKKYVNILKRLLTSVFLFANILLWFVISQLNLLITSAAWWPKWEYVLRDLENYFTDSPKARGVFLWFSSTLKKVLRIYFLILPDLGMVYVPRLGGIKFTYSGGNKTKAIYP